MIEVRKLVDGRKMVLGYCYCFWDIGCVGGRWFVCSLRGNVEGGGGDWVGGVMIKKYVLGILMNKNWGWFLVGDRDVGWV